MIKESRDARRQHHPGRLAASKLGDWGRAHPVVGYIVLAYAMSWSLWSLASLTGAAVSFVLVVAGGFGPAAAAAVMLGFTGRSLREWLRSIVAWRVPLRFYAYALLLPAGLQLGMNAALAMGGAAVDWASLPGRLPGYVASVAIIAVLFGGMEEPGRRGYALPLLQDRHGPVAATMLLGLAWGIWHVLLYGPPAHRQRAPVHPPGRQLHRRPGRTTAHQLGESSVQDWGWFGRNLDDLNALVQRLNREGVRVEFIKRSSCSLPGRAPPWPTSCSRSWVPSRSSDARSSESASGKASPWPSMQQRANIINVMWKSGRNMKLWGRNRHRHPARRQSPCTS